MARVPYCVVTFADGRVKEFVGVPPVPLDVGKYYRITYNDVGEVVHAGVVR